MISSLNLAQEQTKGSNWAIVVRMVDCDLWLPLTDAIPLAKAIEVVTDAKNEKKTQIVGHERDGMHLPPRGGWTVREVVGDQSGCLVLRARDGDYWIPNDQVAPFVAALRALKEVSKSNVDPEKRTITLRRSRHVHVTDEALDSFRMVVDAQREELAKLLTQFGEQAPKESVAYCDHVLAQLNWLRSQIDEIRNGEGGLVTFEGLPPELMPPKQEIGGG